MTISPLVLGRGHGLVGRRASGGTTPRRRHAESE